MLSVDVVCNHVTGIRVVTVLKHSESRNLPVTEFMYAIYWFRVFLHSYIVVVEALGFIHPLHYCLRLSIYQTIRLSCLMPSIFCNCPSSLKPSFFLVSLFLPPRFPLPLSGSLFKVTVNLIMGRMCNYLIHPYNHNQHLQTKLKLWCKASTRMQAQHETSIKSADIWVVKKSQKSIRSCSFDRSCPDMVSYFVRFFIKESAQQAFGCYVLLNILLSALELVFCKQFLV